MADQTLGTFRVDGSGDIANDVGLASYQKRCIRRLTTRRGRFAHLPNYGTDVAGSIKTLNRPGTREALALQAEDQLRQEPETVSARVNVVIDPQHPELAYFRVVVVAGIRATRLQFDAPLPR